MKILAIDTSTEACSAALSVDDEVISRFEIAPRKHTELILPMIDSLMKEAALLPTQLDGLAFTRGPGAFTGVRVATGIIQGIAFAADLPVAPISSLAALAQGQFREQGTNHVISAIDARMKEIYWGFYQQQAGLMKACQPEGVCPADQIPIPTNNDEWLGAGTGWASYGELLNNRLAGKVHTSNSYAYPHSVDVITLAKPMFKSGELVSADQISPVYLRDNVVS